MTTPDTHPHDDLAVYALDALEPDERAVVDAHLATCAACRAELDGYLETLGQMTVPEAPPDHVWEGISQTIRASGTPAPTASSTSTPASTSASSTSTASTAGDGRSAEVVSLDRRRPGRLRSGRVLAMAAAVALVLGIAGAVLLRGGDRSLVEQAQAAADDPDNTVVQLTGDAGEARVVLTSGEDYVLFDDLPALDPDETYQLWRTDEGVPASLGVLGDGDDGVAKVELPPSTKSFALSAEPAGGSETPTEIVAT